MEVGSSIKRHWLRASKRACARVSSITPSSLRNACTKAHKRIVSFPNRLSSFLKELSASKFSRIAAASNVGLSIALLALDYLLTEVRSDKHSAALVSIGETA